MDSMTFEKVTENRMKKYDLVLPDNEIVFWGSVYKAICKIPYAPKDVKHKAVTWLTEHNMTLY